MDLVKSKSKKISVIKNLMQSLPFPKGKTKSSSSLAFLSKSRSYHCPEAEPSSSRFKKNFVAPNGCFPVYVGSEKQRFLVKAKYANHPLFVTLLEDAEMEYGFNSDGPLLIPCDVDFFYKVLAEIDDDNNSGKDEIYHVGCGSCSPFSPARRLGKSSTVAKGYSPYGLLTPPRLLKINHF